MREVEDHRNWYDANEDREGTRYILQLDVFDYRDNSENIKKIWDLLGDSFNVPHDLKLIVQEDVIFKGNIE